MKFSYVVLDQIIQDIGIDKPGNIVYGIPRGGMCACALLQEATVTVDPASATHFLDDVIETGATRAKYQEMYPGIPFHALYDKTHKRRDGEPHPWVEFPWEQSEYSEPEQAVRTLLRFVGENPDREGLKGTPDRVCRYLKEATSGYQEDAQKHLAKNFATDDVASDDDAEQIERYDNMVVVRNIEFFSLCEHHMITIHGFCSIAYIPKEKVVGLSKVARVVDVFAKRLSIQEKMTAQISQALKKGLEVEDVAVIIDAKHYCMIARGVQKGTSSTKTACLSGEFKSDATVRNELMFHLRD